MLNIYIECVFFIIGYIIDRVYDDEESYDIMLFV